MVQISLIRSKKRQWVTVQNGTCVLKEVYQKTVIKMSLYIVEMLLQFDHCIIF